MSQLIATYELLGRALLLLGLVLSGISANADDRLSLTKFIADLDHASKNTITSMPELDQTAVAFLAMLEMALNGEEEMTRKAAKTAGYRLRQVTQAGRDYLVLFDLLRSVGPTIVLAKTPLRELIIEAPHGIADRATDIQSAIALTQLGARALLLAGAHRCASRSESSCSGRTWVCGDGRAPYRTSDTAHNPDTRFHTAHLILTNAWPKALVVQLHGFAIKNTDALVVLSDGSLEKRAGDSELIEQVRDGIRMQFGRRNSAVSCQDPEDDRIPYRKLCARTNVQGRHLNGVEDVCHDSAATASGRFLHIEQAWEIRREVREHWRAIGESPQATVVLDSLGAAIPCTISACR